MIRRNAGENPTAALLIHEASGAVDGIGEDSPLGIMLMRPVRQHDLAVRKAFGNENDHGVRSDFSREERDEKVFADPVDGVDGVAFSVLDDVGEFGRGVLGGKDNRIANLLMDGTKGGEHLVQRKHCIT